MRLICPNCGAQYEISDDAIPEGGRDVQCSNCGHTWFQVSATEAEAAAIAEAERSETGYDEDSFDETDFTDAEDAGPVEAADTPERRPLSEDVQAVFEEEVAFEEAARKSEAETLEYQQDLGLSGDANASLRQEQSRARMARLKGLDPNTDTAEPEVPEEPARKDLLPDIEEINSTLRGGGLETASVPLSDAVEDPVDPQRRGFRTGFGIALLIAVVGLLSYIFAPQISAAVPSLAEPLAGYVEMVNGWRLGLDAQMKAVVEAIQGDSGA